MRSVFISSNLGEPRALQRIEGEKEQSARAPTQHQLKGPDTQEAKPCAVRQMEIFMKRCRILEEGDSRKEKKCLVKCKLNKRHRLFGDLRHAEKDENCREMFGNRVRRLESKFFIDMETS
jgi:hypothetical protein